MNTNLHLDYDALNTLKEIMEDDFVLLVETFIQDSGNRLHILQGLIGTSDYDAVRRAAHSFKGSCSNIGALRLASLCSAVERKGLAGSLESIKEDIMFIEEEFTLVHKMLLDYLH
jgi:histidine phosphotransfer protein HptB